MNRLQRALGGRSNLPLRSSPPASPAERRRSLEKAAGLFPGLPGKDARDVAAIMHRRRDEYSESRRRAGIHIERAYQQETPMGRVVIAYHESDRPFGEVIPAMAGSDLALDREFIKAIKEVHGVDATQPPPGEPPELLADWVDETVSERKRGLAFCAAVMPGATDTARAFTKEAYVARRGELTASRRAVGWTREVVCLNHTPMGDVICVYHEGDDPVAANREFAESRSPYDTWFKEQLKGVFPPEVDLNQPLPPIDEIFDSEKVLVAG